MSDEQMQVDIAVLDKVIERAQQAASRWWAGATQDELLGDVDALQRLRNSLSGRISAEGVRRPDAWVWIEGKGVGWRKATLDSGLAASDSRWVPAYLSGDDPAISSLIDQLADAKEKVAVASEALRPFANFVDSAAFKSAPDTLLMTNSSRLAREQVTLGAFRWARDAFRTLTSEPA